jgi:outer membrane immunogenic protein
MVAWSLWRTLASPEVCIRTYAAEGLQRRIVQAGIALLALYAALLPAAAADMEVDAARGPVYRPRPFIADPWTWAGINIGLNGGYGAGRFNASATFFNGVTGPIALPDGSVTSSNFNFSGGTAGGQIGYSWQFAAYVGGVETDLQWSGQRGSTGFFCGVTPGGGAFGPCAPALAFTPPGAFGVGLAFEQSITWYGTLRAKIGAIFTPRVVGYIMGGFAYGEVKTAATMGGFNAAGAAVATVVTNSQIKGGGTLGAGVEGRLVGALSGRIEYLYVDLGRASGTIVNVPGLIGANYTARVRDQIIRIGVNYHFFSRFFED